MSEVETQKELDFERKHKEDLQRIRNFRLMDDGFMSKVFEEVREEATLAKAIAIAEKMLKAGMPYEEIADIVELSVDEVKALDTKKPA